MLLCSYSSDFGAFDDLADNPEEPIGDNPDDDQWDDEVPHHDYLYDLARKISEECSKKNGPFYQQLCDGNPWILPSNPDRELYRHLVEKKTQLEAIEIDRFYYNPRVFVFAPDLLYPMIKHSLPCKHDGCGGMPFIIDKTIYICLIGSLKPSGWSDRYRRVVDANDNFFIIARRYTCPKGHHIQATTEEVLRQLPLEVQIFFPAILSKRSGLSKEVVESMHEAIDASVGPSLLAQRIKEAHCLRHTKMMTRYYATLRTILEYQDKAADFLLNKNRRLRENTSRIPLFSEFNNCSKYCGFTPSGKS